MVTETPQKETVQCEVKVDRGCCGGFTGGGSEGVMAARILASPYVGLTFHTLKYNSAAGNK